MSSGSRRFALQGYKRLLRASQELFQGDTAALQGSRVELRKHFEANRNVSDADKLKELLKDIDDVEEMMKNNIVQGKLNQRGNYEVSLKTIEDESSCTPKFEPTPVDLKEIEEIEKKKKDEK